MSRVYIQTSHKENCHLLGCAIDLDREALIKRALSDKRDFKLGEDYNTFVYRLNLFVECNHCEEETFLDIREVL